MGAARQNALAAGGAEAADAEVAYNVLLGIVGGGAEHLLLAAP